MLPSINKVESNNNINMKYMGSKNRIAKEIIPIILQNSNKKVFNDVCVGGANLIDKVSDEYIKNAYDVNKYLISMFKALQQGWIPEYYYEKNIYKDIMNNKDKYPEYLVGYLGFNCSYSGKFFGGFAGITKTKEGIRNYQEEALRNISKQMNSLKNVNFYNESLFDLQLQDSIIYCDIPYKGTTKYQNEFDYERFYQWCFQQKERNNDVFISEYEMPDEFTLLWEKEVSSSLSANGKIGGNKKQIEKLYSL